MLMTAQNRGRHTFFMYKRREKVICEQDSYIPTNIFSWPIGFRSRSTVGCISSNLVNRVRQIHQLIASQHNRRQSELRRVVKTHLFETLLDTLDTNYQATKEKNMAVQRTTAGLRDLLFNIIDGVMEDKIKLKKANTVIAASRQIVSTARLELDAFRTGFEYETFAGGSSPILLGEE